MKFMNRKWRTVGREQKNRFLSTSQLALSSIVLVLYGCNEPKDLELIALFQSISWLLLIKNLSNWDIL